jgi:hypothetical protein
MRRSDDGYYRDDLLKYCGRLNAELDATDAPSPPAPDPTHRNPPDMIPAYGRPRSLAHRPNRVSRELE